MTSLHLWSRRLPASLSGGGQLADFLAEVSVASPCGWPADHAPHTTQPTPSTSPLRRAGRRVANDLPRGAWPCCAAAAQRLASAVDDLAHEVVLRVDQPV